MNKHTFLVSTMFFILFLSSCKQNLFEEIKQGKFEYKSGDNIFNPSLINFYIMESPAFEKAPSVVTTPVSAENREFQDRLDFVCNMPAPIGCPDPCSFIQSGCGFPPNFFGTRSLRLEEIIGIRGDGTQEKIKFETTKYIDNYKLYTPVNVSKEYEKFYLNVLVGKQIFKTAEFKSN